MEFYNKVQSQQTEVDQGELKVSVFTEDGTRPIENALVRISYTGGVGNTVEEVRTDSSGQTPTLDLKTPPLEYSMEPVEQQPYSEYTIQVLAEGFENGRDSRIRSSSRGGVSTDGTTSIPGERRV